MLNYDFVLKETNGADISLKDFKGKNVVLYFYPKDNTSGCTTEALEFMDLYDEFQKQDTIIMGISRDNLKSHAKFRDKHNLPFLLLSDENEEIHNLFNVMKLKKMYGKEYMGVERSTFIFNKEGELVKEFRNVKAKGHAEKVLEFIKNGE
ncbi:peroxiredoxin Q/BCP [Tissierella praeacuta DSM 18095]|uniref:thioredoxin-dependent peroxiredoxin n=1 Tax=Tissierella praeacuta DSM 18095 TaxID=1123404 RepID=A0A1M4ZT63_9FIRM|nr:peroxiredoxin [Tissierella praeacuta]SHF21253.1 peroxiredoxin Q/BCP [Tissierella praeacuta DSM 18095]SUP04873.1 Putative peroxiredoxin bcp [Tissierella praeacuta]